MVDPPRFSDVVEAIDQLSFEEQVAISSLLENRLRDQKRRRLVERVQASRSDFERGDYKPATVDEIMREAGS